MGIYSAFNALGLGNAANNTQQQKFLNRKSAIDQMASGLGSVLEQKRIDDEEKKRRQSAIDYLTGRGIDAGKAEQLSDAIGGQDVARLFLGREFGDSDYERMRADRKADTEDERSYAEKKAEMDEARAFDTWLKQNGITYNQGVKSSQYGQLMNQLAMVLAKDYGNSIQGVKDRNAAVGAIKEFVKANPEYADVLKAFSIESQDVNDQKYSYFDENIISKLNELAEGGNTEAVENYLKDLEKNGKLTYIQKDPKFADALNRVLRSSDLKRLTPYIVTEGLNNGNVTTAQRAKQIDEAAASAEYENAVKELDNAYKGIGKYKGKNADEIVKMLNFSDSIIEKLKKDKKKNNRGLRQFGYIE